MRRPFGHGPVAWFLKRALLVAGVVVVATWLMLWIDRRTLPGIRVQGTPLPRTSDPVTALKPLAGTFAQGEIEIRTGAYLTRAKRQHLGASLDPIKLAPRLLELGRSGNPLADVSTFFGTWTRGRDFTWPPSIDRIELGAYVQAIRRNVERPPLAGATDEQGWSIKGVPGITLDTVSTVDQIERALRMRQSIVDVPLRQIPPPQALAMGSPDAVLYDDESEHHAHDDSLDIGGVDLSRYAAAMRAARPRSWQPDRGKEPMDPPYEKYGQGPRKVPVPWGEPEMRARGLGLGEVLTVGHLLNAAPRPEWVMASGHMHVPKDMLWPVPTGRLWRRFGFVRRAEWAHKLHRGIDIGAPHGTPIVAVNDGIVAYSDNSVRGYGNLLVIIHVDSSVTFSAHCQSVFVFAGQRVRRGQVVGEVGDTGLARGAHVHFEYHAGGQPADPMPRFARM